MVFFTDIAKKIGRFQLVCDDLKIENGEIVGVCGASGCGKTVFAGLAGGALKPDYGRIEIDGIDLYSGKGSGKGVSYVPYRDLTYGEFSVAAYLDFLRSAYCLSEEEMRAKLNWFDDYYPVKKYLEKRICTLSDGQVQILKIFTSLINSPSFLVIDEPFSALGDYEASWLIKLLQELAAKGVAVLVCSNHISSFEALCNRVLVLSEGKVSSLLSSTKIKSLAENFGKKYEEVVLSYFDRKEGVLPFLSAGN